MDGQTGRILLCGEYDVFRRAELGALFDEIGGPCTLDFSRVTYCDSTFFGELIALRKRLPEAAITIIGATANVRRLFTMLSLQNLFHIVD